MSARRAGGGGGTEYAPANLATGKPTNQRGGGGCGPNELALGRAAKWTWLARFAPPCESKAAPGALFAFHFTNSIFSRPPREVEQRAASRCQVEFDSHTLLFGSTGWAQARLRARVLVRLQNAARGRPKWEAQVAVFLQPGRAQRAPRFGVQNRGVASSYGARRAPTADQLGANELREAPVAGERASLSINQVADRACKLVVCPPACPLAAAAGCFTAHFLASCGPSRAPASAGDQLRAPRRQLAGRLHPRSRLLPSIIWPVWRPRRGLASVLLWRSAALSRRPVRPCAPGPLAAAAVRDAAASRPTGRRLTRARRSSLSSPPPPRWRRDIVND